MEFLDVPDEMQMEFIQSYTQSGQLDLMAGVFDGDLDQLWMMQNLLDRHDTLKGKADLLDELVASHSKMKRCCRYLRDGFGIMACPACQQATFDTLLDIEQILSKVKDLK